MSYLARLASKLIAAYIVGWLCIFVFGVICIELIKFGYSFYTVVGVLLGALALIALFIILELCRGMKIVKNMWNAEVGISDMPSISNPITIQESQRLRKWIEQNDQTIK